MSTWRQLRAWLRAPVFRARVEREMREEMAAHLDQSTARYVARGMSIIDARYAAQREFGAMGVMQDAGRDARGARLLHGVIDDVRYAFRHFARTPRRTALIVFVLTLGIGITAATISAAQGLLHRPPPGVTADTRLVVIRGQLLRDGRRRDREFSYAEFQEYARASQVFDRVIGWTQSGVVLETGNPERPAVASTAHFVTPGYFTALGVRLSAGRGFALERGAHLEHPSLEVILTERLATQLFGAPERAIDKHVRVNDRLLRVVGVTARRFHGVAQDGSGRAIWMPLAAQRVVEPGSSAVFTNSDTVHFHAFTHLRDGVSSSMANAALAAIAQRAATRRLDFVSTGTNQSAAGRWTADIAPLVAGIRLDEARGDDVALLSAIGGAVVLILLICTMTVATLLIGAALQRHGEIGVRLALGASRRRIIRQLLTESAVLCVVATTAGLLLYSALCRSVLEGETDLDIAPDWSTLVYTILVAALTTVVCGLVPALNATRHSLADTLKQSAPTTTNRSRLQKIFVATQIALTQPMLVGLALLLAILSRGLDSASGRAASERLTLAIFDPTVPESAKRSLSGREIARRIALVPGVVSAVSMPLAGHLLLEAQIGGVPGERGNGDIRRVQIATSSVSAAFFRTLDLPIVRGRDFRDTDRTDALVPAIITADVAARLFGADNPIGQRISSTTGMPPGVPAMRPLEIVGVAANDPRSSDEETRNRVYTLTDADVPSAVLIRTADVAEPLFPAFRAILNAEAPMVPLQSLRTYAQIDADKRRQLLQAAGAASAAGVVTLLLAAIGLFAVIALAVGQRHREIGIRIALGARSAQVVGHFLRGGLRLTATGLAFGLPASAIALSFVGGRSELPALDVPVIAISIAAIVIAVALFATWLSARKAATIDPMIVMRDA